MIKRLNTWIKSKFRALHENSLVHDKKFYYVGDVAPDSLLNRKGGNIGAMVSIDPETNVIKAIFIP